MYKHRNYYRFAKVVGSFFSRQSRRFFTLCTILSGNILANSKSELETRKKILFFTCVVACFFFAIKAAKRVEFKFFFKESKKSSYGLRCLFFSEFVVWLTVLVVALLMRHLQRCWVGVFTYRQYEQRIRMT